MKIIEHASGLVAGPGLYRMPASVYHADPAPTPSLSRSVAVTLLDKRPLHAWHAHPRLGGGDEDAKARKLDVGSVAHELMIGQGRGIHVIAATNKAGKDVENYATKAAQEERDDALAAGLTPVLRCDLDRAEAMVDAVRSKLARVPGAAGAFEDGLGEAVAIWRDPAGVYGRCMLDWWGPTEYDVWDLKTTAGGLSDRDLANRIDAGLDVQAAWYSRGLSILRPEAIGRVTFNFVFVEDKPPHEVRVIRLTGEQQARGERKAVTAAVWFADCLARNEWPGYAPTIDRVESPPWTAARWEEREIGDPALQALGSKLLLAHSHQAPLLEAAE